MKLPWTTQGVDSLTRPDDRRWAVRWCSVCRIARGPLIYLQNGKHYCQPCASKVYAVMGIQAVGRRATDLRFPERPASG